MANNYHRIRQIMTSVEKNKNEKRGKNVCGLFFFIGDVLATLFGYRFCGGSTWRDNYNVNKWVFVIALSLVPAKLTAVYRKKPSTYWERKESVLCLVASTWKRVLLERKRQFNAQVTKASERCDYVSSFIRFAEWTEKHTHSSHPIAECARVCTREL